MSSPGAWLSEGDPCGQTASTPGEPVIWKERQSQRLLSYPNFPAEHVLASVAGHGQPGPLMAWAVLF